MGFWFNKTMWLLVSVAVALLLGLYLRAPGWCVALCLFLWLVFEWSVTAKVARQVDRGIWPPLEGIAAVRRLLRAGRGRLKRQRLRTRRMVGILSNFREAATALPDGTLILDEDGQLLWFNAQAARLLDLRYPGDLGRVFSHLLRHPRLRDWLESGCAEPLLDMAAPGNEQIRLSYRQVAYAQQLRLLVVRDISNLMKLEQMRQDFVANVSHELRTPLTVVNGYLDTIDDDEVPELAPVLSQMRAQSRRMVQIVEDLLTLSRLDANERQTDEDVDMHTLLRQLQRDGEGLSRGRHRIEIRQDLEMDVRGCAKDLHSAFGNLVSNAVRYSPEGGLIRLRWATHARGAVFTVEDQGIGIPAEHLPRLTERFYRVSGSRSRETGGTGLGLAIVKHVLMRHQGELEIRSEMGKGSCFGAVLPASRLLPVADPPADEA